MYKFLILTILIFSPSLCNSNEFNKVISEYFPNQIKVFGVKIIGTEKTPYKSIQKAEIVLSQWLDNNGDGKPDNRLVIDALIQNNATLIMGNSESDLENSFEQLIEILEEEIDIDNFERSLVGLISNEPNISYLEEILHLVTQLGYAKAYPNIFGEFKGSKISKAMDVARGGFFEKTPMTYPKSAWYHYDDKSCDYACMITEYFYWSLTSLLGAQVDRYDEIFEEWELNTPIKMKNDNLVMKLLQNKKYQIPSKLPIF